jgi:glucose/arabinose dehydrogenase
MNRLLTGLIVGTLALALAGPAWAQKVPASASEVARPGGKLPGTPNVVLFKFADGFNDPVNVVSANDGTGRIFVVERVGRIKIVNKDGKVNPKPFLDLTHHTVLGSEVQTGFVEQGLWSVAFHPKFKQNGYFYVHYSSLPFNGAAIVLRMQVDSASPNEVSVDRANKTSKVIMNVPYPYYNHYGGDIRFGKDGYLYIGRGDGGWEGDVLDAGQRLETYLAKMLRIDVDVADDELASYHVPKTNPLARAVQDRPMVLFGVTEEGFGKIHLGAKPEIWAYGLRNPYKFHFDSKTGDMWISDVGQNHLEEINWQPAASKGGENYGWSRNMGTNCHPMKGANDKCPQVGVLPVAQYPHEEPYPGAAKLTDGFGCAVMGFGVAYYGGLNGAYVAGDWCTGRVWAVGWDGSKWQMQQLFQANLMFTGGNPDEDGTLMTVNCYCFYTDDKGPTANPKGALWKLVAADKVPAGAEKAQVR